MTKQVDYEVTFTETVTIDNYTNEQDAIDLADAQIQMLYPAEEGNTYRVINVSDV